MRAAERIRAFVARGAAAQAAVSFVLELANLEGMLVELESAIDSSNVAVDARGALIRAAAELRDAIAIQRLGPTPEGAADGYQVGHPLQLPSGLVRMVRDDPRYELTPKGARARGTE